MKKLVLMGQKGFNQLPEVGPELVVDKDGKATCIGHIEVPKQFLHVLNNHPIVWPDVVNLPNYKNAYVDFAFSPYEHITIFTLFYDCISCHGSGCYRCGGGGRSMHNINKEDADRWMQLVIPPQPSPELKFKNGDFER